ncbi:hypothetical protein [Glycomyces sp. YM15]|uniref:hypothetical protein n=1 Tax=Glycomyces sp. YM15 TaxID=2800446 RepID=UPI0019625521|nr:hypothetical protein [Glycomyces sp. YM15]
MLSLLTVAFRRSLRGTAILRKPMADMAIRGNFERHEKEPEMITEAKKDDPAAASCVAADRAAPGALRHR